MAALLTPAAPITAPAAVPMCTVTGRSFASLDIGSIEISPTSKAEDLFEAFKAKLEFDKLDHHVLITTQRSPDVFGISGFSSSARVGFHTLQGVVIQTSEGSRQLTGDLADKVKNATVEAFAGVRSSTFTDYPNLEQRTVVSGTVTCLFLKGVKKT